MHDSATDMDLVAGASVLANFSCHLACGFLGHSVTKVLLMTWRTYWIELPLLLMTLDIHRTEKTVHSYQQVSLASNILILLVCFTHHAAVLSTTHTSIAKLRNQLAEFL